MELGAAATPFNVNAARRARADVSQLLAGMLGCCHDGLRAYTTALARLQTCRHAVLTRFTADASLASARLRHLFDTSVPVPPGVRDEADSVIEHSASSDDGGSDGGDAVSDEGDSVADEDEDFIDLTGLPADTAVARGDELVFDPDAAEAGGAGVGSVGVAWGAALGGAGAEVDTQATAEL
jgi:hypothetical protein